jgi:crotonobetainyl-CoA:carnitine CoA-transferase CaiB-like acyl-CoA transferase
VKIGPGATGETLFQHFNVPASAVQTFDEHLSDPQTIHNEIYEN